MKSIEEQRGDVTIEIISNSFNDLEPHIQRSFRENEDFRLLCEDYAVCALALENWKSADAPMSRNRCEEYVQMLAELEQEIRNWLLER